MIRGTRSDAMPKRIVSDEQQRSLPELARPEGKLKNG